MHPNDNVHAHAIKWKELLKNIISRWGEFTPTNLEPLQTVEEERNKLHACLFLSGLDRGKYGHVVQELNNDYLLSQTGYPKSVDEMIIYLDSRMERRHNNKKQGHKNGNKSNDDNVDDGDDGGLRTTSFAQAASEQATEQHTEAQFNQYLTRHGISYHDFSFGADSDSDSDYITDWHGGKTTKTSKKKKK
jgi:hypothetical protein